jgi:hypothetical protein
MALIIRVSYRFCVHAERCKIGSGPQNDWYFFSHKDKKYPTGTRTNRATAAGFWKATGRDKAIYSAVRRMGMRKTLVFYRGRAPHGHKSDWIMHEYRLDDPDAAPVAATVSMHSSSGSIRSDIPSPVPLVVVDNIIVCVVTNLCNNSRTHH